MFFTKVKLQKYWHQNLVIDLPKAKELIMQNVQFYIFIVYITTYNVYITSML